MTVSGFIGLIAFSVDGVLAQYQDVPDVLDQGVRGKALNTLDANGPGGSGGGTGGGLKFTASDTPPDGAIAGDEWLNTTTGVQFEWFVDDNGGQWIEWIALDGGGARGIKYFSQDTAPDTAIAGDQWLDTSSGIQYTLVDDGDTIQWVEHF